jgi:hypothetical protein
MSNSFPHLGAFFKYEGVRVKFLNLLDDIFLGAFLAEGT